ncbi:MAG: hypothetical protein V1916_03015 [Patescibacteria group bacterium]
MNKYTAYALIILAGAVVSSVILFVPALQNVGTGATGYPYLSVFGMWGVPVVVGVLTAIVTRRNEAQHQLVKILLYPLLALTIYSILVIVAEMIRYSPFEYATTPAGSRYNTFSFHTVFLPLGMPFAIVVGFITGAVQGISFSVAHRAARALQQ